MNKRYVFALVISLAAAPALAQTPPPSPVEAGAVGPSAAPPVRQRPVRVPPPEIVPARPVPFGLPPLDIGPVGPGPLGIGPIEVPPLMRLEMPPIDVPTFPVPIVDARLFAAESRLLVDRMAFELGQDRGRDREAEMREREREREGQLYSEGWDAAGEYRWDRALGYFNRVIELKGTKLDAAMYWKAYSQNRLGQRSEALSTIAELTKNHPNSPYRKQANMLEAEVRRDLGQPVRPQDSADDDVKLMALAALQNTAPEEAIPMLEKVLEGTSGPKVKQRALFVLAQSKSPRAREVMRNYAKGSSTPELQSQAIQYLGVHGGPENRAVLQEVYGSTSDVDVKRRILRAFMVSGDKERLFRAAQSEQTPELRAEAVGQLGHMSAHEELSQLYQKETSVEVKRRILRSMQVGGSIDRLVELAKAEQNPELRREAVRMLGVMRSTRTGDVLVQIYSSDSNADVKKAAINALFIQENAPALVALARKEQDINLKKEIIGRLSHMRSKVATDYMIELLGK